MQMLPLLLLLMLLRLLLLLLLAAVQRLLLLCNRLPLLLCKACCFVKPATAVQLLSIASKTFKFC